MDDLLPMTPAEVAAACTRLPVFPLPRTVLMPSTVLPLHVFEPRYRALVRHCLAGTPVLGIATLRPGFEARYHEAPDVWPEIGVGRIVAHERLADGRSNVLVASIGRAILTEELPSFEPFRLVRCAPVDDDDDDAGAVVTRLRALVLQLGPASAPDAEQLVRLPARRMVDALASRVFQDPDEQRAYLATGRLTQAAGRVWERLAQQVAPRGPAADA